MAKTLKVVFFGTSNFAVPALKLLIESGYNIPAVFTGLGPVNVFAQEHGIKIFQPVSLKKEEQVYEEFKDLKPDICIIAAYGKIIPQKFLDIPRYGFLNIHPSLLPKYRGPSPIQTAILNGDPAPILSADHHSEKGRDWCGAGTETGVTIMLVDEQVDHGPILAQKTYNLRPDVYYKEAEMELAEIGAKLLTETIPEYISGKIKPKEQNHSQATFTKMFSRDAGRINWSESAGKIYDRIRALNPEPGTWTTWNGKIINIKKAELRDGKINIQTIQMEGKREMSFEEFLHGHPDFDISQLN